MNDSNRSIIHTTLLVLSTIVGALAVLWLVALLLHVAM